MSNWFAKHWASQEYVDIFLVFHVIGGVLAFLLSATIIGDSHRDEPDKQTELLWVAFFSCFVIHSIWELWETTKSARDFWNLPSLRHFFSTVQDLGLSNRLYKGDSLPNSIVDTSGFILGFWITYAIVGLPKAS